LNNLVLPTPCAQSNVQTKIASKFIFAGGVLEARQREPAGFDCVNNQTPTLGTVSRDPGYRVVAVRASDAAFRKYDDPSTAPAPPCWGCSVIWTWHAACIIDAAGISGPDQGNADAAGRIYYAPAALRI
jgi:hypothetical protein